MVKYFFYKNISVTAPLWYYGVISGWSGQTYFLDVYMVMFNVIFTSLPPFVFAIQEQHIVEEKLNKMPEVCFLPIKLSSVLK